MTATPSDVQAKLDAAVAALKKTTWSYPSMVTKHGNDPTKWPTTSSWYIAFNQIAAARAETGQLVTPAPPTATFTFKEV